jgi:copper(I)-binding protein
MIGAVSTVFARRMPLLAAALVPLALATACGSGLNAQTYEERTTQDATNQTVGRLALRDVAILPPENGASELAMGKDALATLTIVNLNNDSDTLLSVSSPGATSVDLVDSSGHAIPTVQIPAQGSVGPQDFSLALRGLIKPLRPGMYVDVTFTFDKNGRSHFLVPVKVFDTPLPRVEKSAAPSE